MKKLLLALLLLAGTSALAAAPVWLQFSQDVSFVLANARVIHQVSGAVEVENLAYVEQMDIFYTLDGVAWQSTEVGYDKLIASGKDVFTFGIPMPESDYNNSVYRSRSVRFAVRYQVAGQTAGTTTAGRTTSSPRWGSAILRRVSRCETRVPKTGAYRLHDRRLGDLPSRGRRTSRPAETRVRYFVHGEWPYDMG